MKGVSQEPTRLRSFWPKRRVEVDQPRVTLAVAAVCGQPTGHHRDEAAAGLGPVRVGLLEGDARAREGVEARGRFASVPPEAHVIGAQRVDGDEEHIQAVSSAG